MQELFVRATEASVLVIESMALIVIVLGTLEAFVNGLRVSFSPANGGQEVRAVLLRYGRWLVAGLTFQLAADIIETSVAPDWEDVGRLAAIAVIRTFLNYFLERDLSEARERRLEPANEVSST